MMEYRIYPLGESAATIDFGNIISNETNGLVADLSDAIEKSDFRGFVECVPAYSSLTVFYDVCAIGNDKPKASSGFEHVKTLIEIAVTNISEIKKAKPKTHEIEVSFDKEFALDLEYVAEKNNLERRKVIEIFLSKTYRVFMLGFLPGFAYMGEVDERIATARKRTPRTKVPKGSVGIAGTQTGIYPLESPGGWQIIGKTKVELFTPQDKKPTLFSAGELIKFTER